MGNRIRELRKEDKLTMKQLGEKIGVAESTISQYETGKREPDNDTTKKIADFFHVSIDYLLGYVSEPWFYLDDEKTLRWANSYEEDPDLDKQLSGIDFALSGEIHDLTDAEKQDILDYIRFKKSQRGGGNK